MHDDGLHRRLERYGIAHSRAVCRDPKSIRPRLIDQIAARLASFDIVVELEILNEYVIGYQEGPDIAPGDRPVGILLIDAPVVRPAGPLHAFGRCIAGAGLKSSKYTGRIRCLGAGYGVSVGAEIDGVLRGRISNRPAHGRGAQYIRSRVVTGARVPGSQ